MRIDPRILLMGGFLVAAYFAGKKLVANWKDSLNAQKYLPALNAAEDANQIPRDLLARLAYQESHFRQDIISGALKSAAGAIGIVQIVPRWHPNVNASDPYEAIPYAGRYLKQLRDQFGSWKLALAAYNWGPGNVAKYRNLPEKWPEETVKYVRDITRDVPVV